MPTLRRRNLYFCAVGLLFSLLAYIVVFSNHDDWDFFFTSFEVDLRSWLIDGKPPLWSYQLCAGSTRLGDPQAFGLSPLFLPIVLFGSFWGAKALVLLCWAAGYFSLSRLFAILATGEETSDPELRLAFSSLALFVMLGNFFVCHLSTGQLTFALFPVAFLVAYLAVRLYLKGWSNGTAMLLFAAAFSYLTGGLYHSLVFLVIPSLAILGTVAAVHFARARKAPSRSQGLRAAPVIALLGLAAAAAAYKLAGVLRYQLEFSRTVYVGGDTNSISHMLMYFFVPTYNFRFGGVSQALDVWGVFEYSAFSFIQWACVIALIWLAREKMRARKIPGQLFASPELIAASLFAFLFCLGDSAWFSPHALLNSWLYHGSVRVVGRYHLLLVLLAAIFLARLVAISPGFRAAYSRRLMPIGILIQAFSLATFLPLTDFKRFAEYSRLPLGNDSQMEKLVRVTPRIFGERTESYMYPAIRLGGIVLNCYQAIRRQTQIASETEFDETALPGGGHLASVFVADREPLKHECVSTVSVTQNEIRFDPGACPDGICFRINMQNSYRQATLKFDEKRHLFCAKP